jgi:hypothetical protein
MARNQLEDPPFRFTGFSAPRYTQVPDELFDLLLPHLTGSELKVLLYIVRRTFGFKKDYDDISLTQLVDGIRTTDGRILDQGTGLNRDTVITALKSLTAMNVILKKKNQSQEKGFEANTYALNIVGLNLAKIPPSPENPISPSPKNPTRANPKNPTSPSPENPTYNKQINNKTVIQQTVTTTAMSPVQTNVVVALSAYGVSERVAKKLVLQYGADYCATKIEYFEFISATDPALIKKNPQGWLRRAIEEDYARPAGFVAKSEQEQRAQAQLARVEERAQQMEQETQRIAEERAQKEALDQAYRKQLSQRYGTTADDVAFWEKALQELTYVFAGQSMRLTDLSQAKILQRKEGVVLLGFCDESSKRQLSHPGTMKKIEKTLSQLVGQPLQVEYELVPAPS